MSKLLEHYISYCSFCNMGCSKRARAKFSWQKSSKTRENEWAKRVHDCHQRLSKNHEKSFRKKWLTFKNPFFIHFSGIFLSHIQSNSALLRSTLHSTACFLFTTMKIFVEVLISRIFFNWWSSGKAQCWPYRTHL